MLWVDAEVHVLPPEWCGPRYRAPRRESAVNRAVYDHPDRALALSGATADALLGEMDRAGIDRAVIMGLPWRARERCWRNNAYVSELVSKWPDRFLGMAVLPAPTRSDPLRDAVRRVHEEWGLAGVKTIPSWQGFRLDDQRFAPALEELAERDLVLVPHTDHCYLPPQRADTPAALLEVARRYPKLRILAPHLGGLLCLYALHEPVRRLLGSVLFVTSVPLTQKMVEFAAQAVGADRLAFGTDFPFNPSHDQVHPRADFEALSLTEPERRLIEGENVNRFLRWRSGGDGYGGDAP